MFEWQFLFLNLKQPTVKPQKVPSTLYLGIEFGDVVFNSYSWEKRYAVDELIGHSNPAAAAVGLAKLQAGPTKGLLERVKSQPLTPRGTDGCET